ncbi:MAG: type IV pilus assembly protein PilM [Deltaproteobacteria bacterium]|nr:type IV pilus assembly protein PilM [Deltaproteobacteria bacterium]MBW2122126.1 type IV pilus assembly protein PilM [Deltaproteobacteria bacterium]
MLFGKKKDVIGLDIGSSSIKIIELNETNKGYRLINCAMSVIPPEAIVDGSLMDSVAIVDTIRDLVKSFKIKTKEVVTSVSGHSVIVKKISLPVITEDELAESIQWEAERYIPFDASDVNIDFQILGSNEENSELMDVVLVAAKKDIINDYLSVLLEAGLNPVIIDIDAFALENMFQTNYPTKMGEVVGLVDIGANVMNINIVKDGISAFTRDVFKGGSSITEEIQKHLHVDYEEAEALKVGSKIDDSKKRAIDSILKTASDEFASEISQSLDYFQKTSNQNLDRLFVSGGCSKIEGLTKAIEAQVGVPVEVVDPFQNIEVTKKDLSLDYINDISPFMAVGVGLALRRVGDR